MSVISVLPESMSNKIAAGEVIERPASVVKELVENAIDAGADKICVNIEQAGMKLISVTDSGSGMDPDDALMCLEQHATSKIARDEDIFAIRTLGFRGEAIPSMASISRFTLRTRQAHALEGTEVFVQGGRVIRQQPSGCAPGTEVEVRDLFFNTPARKKFMRAPGTEEKHIQETLMMLSLPYPRIAFELTMDGRKIFSSPAHDELLPRLQTYFGKEMASHMLPVSFSDESLSVNGYVARHGFTRNSRREQRVFVNGRPVDALPVFNGIRDGYGSLVEKGRFPPVVLFIAMDAGAVDVNVHPAKREVRFRNSRKVTSVVAETVAMALRGTGAPTVSLDPSLSLKNILDGSRIDYAPRDENLVFEFKRGNAYIPEPDQAQEEEWTPQPESVTVPEAPPGRPASAATTVGASVRPEHLPPNELGALQVLGFLDNTYIVCSTVNGMLVVDQHAAHERVIYERLLKSSREGMAASQRLLLPLTLELSRAEAAFAGKHSAALAELGFDIEFIGEHSVMISAIPAALHQNNAATVVKDIISNLSEGDHGRTGTDFNAMARAACIAAVKAHDHLSFEEARGLLRQMAQCELPFSCPHGRPTVINISFLELEKRFGRR